MSSTSQWLTPLRTGAPLLAEYMGSRGYATAGFVANTGYCSYDTGLARGFTYYEDYVPQETCFPSDGRFRQGNSEALCSSLATPMNQVSCDSVPEFVEALVLRRRSQGRGIDQSRVSRLASPPARGSASVFRVSQLHGRPCALQAAGWSAAPLRSQAPSREEIRIIHDGWDLIDKIEAAEVLS